MNRSFLRLSDLRDAIAIWASVLLLAVAMTACASRQEDPKNDVKPGPETITVDSPDQAVDLAKKSQLTCDDPARCSPSVALLTAIENKQIYLCTSFLLNDHLAITL